MKAGIYRPKDLSYHDSLSAGSSHRAYIPQDALYFLKAPPAMGPVVEEPMELYGSLSQGYGFDEVLSLIEFLGFTQMELSKLFEVDSSTLSRWRKSPKPIGLLRSRLVRELDALVAKGVRIFGSEPAFAQWLDAPQPALGGGTPKRYLQHPEGLFYVDDLLEGMSWGNFS